MKNNLFEDVLTFRSEAQKARNHREDDGCPMCVNIKEAMATTPVMDFSWMLGTEPVDDFDYSDEARELVEV